MNSFINDIITIFRHLTIYKVINVLQLTFSFFLSVLTKKNIQFGKFYSLSIEPTNHCNLKCPECPTGNNSMLRDKGNMNFELFKNIIQNNYKSLINIVLYFQGEPYLNNSFFDFIRYAKKHNIYTITSTNAHYLNEENAIKTIESGLDRLIISLDGHNQNIYSKYRKNGDFEKVIQGINNLVKSKKNLNSSKPYIIVQYLYFKHNEEYIEDFKSLIKPLNIDKLEFKTAQLYDYQKGHPFMPETKDFSRYIKTKNNSYSLKKKIKNRCFRMWFACVITYDGKVIPCCFDKDINYYMGNIKEETLHNIWKNQKYLSFRKQIFKNRKNINICCNCTE